MRTGSLEQQRSRAVRAGQRLALVALGLVLGVATVGVAELVLRIAGVASDRGRYDPFAGFSRSVPMFEPAQRADGTSVFRTARARRVRSPQEFLAVKPADGFRVFVVGESSAAGVPYDVGHAFSAFLQQRLTAALPQRHVEVVNAAVPGYGTRRMLPVVEDIVQHEPDLLVLYAGHNEFAEPRYYAHLVGMDPRLFRAWEALASTRLYALATRLPGIGVDIEPKPPHFDFETLDNPLQMFAVRTQHLEGAYPTDRERAWAEQHYRFNVETMVDLVQGAGGRVMLVTIGQNLADWAPGGAAHGTPLDAARLAAWDDAVAEGDRRAADDACASALDAYRRAAAIDATHAGLRYKIAGCLRRLEHWDEARAEYLAASDLDRMPHGAPSRFNEVLREVAAERGTLFVDAAAVLQQASPHGLVGDDQFIDLVHPNLLANERIAAAIADGMRAAGIPVPAAQWTDDDPVPPVEMLYAGEPGLRTQERLVRASACLLAQRDDCARQAIDAVLASDPKNALALELRSGMARRGAAKRDGEATATRDARPGGEGS
ncbi:SGNH/GDSL hydrolase family protein [Candidatus Binatia bacterium]|nr:SGNH/GDSL hydrolase family protein [Candidatus Binatia bacterium]